MTLLQFAIVAALVVGPLLLGVAGIARRRQARAADAAPTLRPAWDWRLSVSSCLLYALAFNLVFLLQEIFLVLPKAITPGLTPTLFHNNHTWTGDHPLVGLLQGTGAVAILCVGLLFLGALTLRTPQRTVTTQLFFAWMAYHGLFQSLSQAVIGAMNPRNDVGMALEHLALSGVAKTGVALVALALFAPVAFVIARHLLALTGSADRPAGPGRRSRDIFLIATLPAIVGILLIIPFRVPRDWVEVALLPAIITWIGIVWMQAGAWRLEPAPFHARVAASVALPLGALLAVLALFQLLLRPGIRFG